MSLQINQFVWNLKALFYKWLRSFFAYRWIYQSEIRPFKKWLFSEIHRGKNYLDLATGSGDSLQIYSPENLPIGIDFSFSMLRILKSRFATPLVQAEATKLPFKNGSFAGITAIGLAEYVKSPGELLLEISRVLETDGWLGITISQPNILNLLRNFTGNYLYFYSVKKFSEIASDCGFQFLESNKTLFQSQLYFRKKGK